MSHAADEKTDAQTPPARAIKRETEKSAPAVAKNLQIIRAKERLKDLP
jgi:hypothetical protein